MIARLTTDCTLREKARIIDAVEHAGLRAHVSRTDGREHLGAPGADEELARNVARLRGVEAIVPERAPYPLVSLDQDRTCSRVRVGPVTFGGETVHVAAGPCAVENERQMTESAHVAARAGASLLRGGAFKPRTSPYSFQGLGERGLELLARSGRDANLPVVTEVVSPADVELVARYADMLQIGARNMQNFSLLRAVGEIGKPILLKRGMMSTIEELLLAAEYIVDGGNPDVVLCERGIRSFDRATRNTFDVTAIPLLKRETHLPVIADPSHGCGIRDLVPHVARAAIAAGADGLIIEMHPHPDDALSDGPQSLTPAGFHALMRSLTAVVVAVGRSVHPGRAGVPGE